MTTWTTKDAQTLSACARICRLFGYRLDWKVGTQGISEFGTIHETDMAWRMWGHELDKTPWHEHQSEKILALILKEVMGL